MTQDLMQKVVSLCKRRGFVYPTSEIYGGFISSYDYGPVGTPLLRNIKNLWWNYFVERRDDMVGLDSQIILHPKTWEASGHIQNFADYLIECLECHKRIRIDQFAGAEYSNEYVKIPSDAKCPYGDHELNFKNMNLVPGWKEGAPVKFNGMFKTHVGATENGDNTAYLRPETAQGIFSNFSNVVDSMRIKLPFGIGQIGKSFRNEITTGQFIFRTLEFEQAEIEYFFNPKTVNWEKLFIEWKDFMWEFVTKSLGAKEENLKWRRHEDGERSFYSKETYDLEYNFPFGWKELWGIAYRTDYDLSQHAKFSGLDLNYRDPDTNEVFIPHVIEPAVGINRLFFMVLSDAYFEDDQRIVLKLHPKLAPYKFAVFPLVRNKPELTEKAKKIFSELRTQFYGLYDDRGNIGKRYLAQDEIGTPWCITVDYQTLEDDTVTIRHRDTTLQERVNVAKLNIWFTEKLTTK